MDVTAYLKTYVLSAKELAAKIIQDVLGRTGITATAGIGTNLYLCKITMDIVAKKACRTWNHHLRPPEKVYTCCIAMATNTA